MKAKRPVSATARWMHWAANSVLAVLAVIWLVPLIWMILVAIRPPDEAIVQGNIFFGTRLTPENFQEVFAVVDWGQQYITSLIFVFGTLAAQLITITLAGYAFARMQFRGKRLLFMLVLVQLMIPSAVLLVPNFATIRTLGLFDTKAALILPYVASAFGTFLMRQTFRQVPIDFEDAARMDGANWFQILWNVYLPSARAALIAFGLVSISSRWNEFLWPFVITRSASNRTLTVGLTQILRTSEVGALYGQIMAGVLIVIAPLMILFLLFQKQFINSFIRSGLK